MQDAACDRALQVAEQMALSACAGFFGIMFTSVKLLPIILACFGICLILFVVMLAKKQIPKVSTVVTILEKIGIKIRAKDGTNNVINTMPAKTTAGALTQMGVPVER